MRNHGKEATQNSRIEPGNDRSAICRVTLAYGYSDVMGTTRVARSQTAVAHASSSDTDDSIAHRTAQFPWQIASPWTICFTIRTNEGSGGVSGPWSLRNFGESLGWPHFSYAKMQGRS